MCGAVTVRVDAPFLRVTGCHCGNCARWSGGLFLSIEVPRDKVQIDGPVKSHAATSFSERGWCDTCGSSVYLRNTGVDDDGEMELMPGLFENFGGARLTRIVYADRCPDGLSIGGDIERVSAATYEAENLHVEDQR
ncbi:GFA family protein [Sulfitobacter aestuariivivens]|uniref:GFA family protein n=1 Tax=Sulfitobacter aestuariivivens TaxID=2766981 RepID=A0A927D5Q2_9RHOB|nr:GFA family protein [Sulfitobacter aestuariivivens]MBD3665449.1 GFA family protein [Sulfitobacter aestuariivivens]